VSARNASRSAKMAVELASLRALPAKRLETLERTRQEIAVWYAQHLVLRLERLYGRGK
jgi:hypothetical protein